MFWNIFITVNISDTPASELELIPSPTFMLSSHIIGELGHTVPDTQLRHWGERDGRTRLHRNLHIRV